MFLCNKEQSLQGAARPTRRQYGRPYGHSNKVTQNIVVFWYFWYAALIITQKHVVFWFYWYLVKIGKLRWRVFSRIALESSRELRWPSAFVEFVGRAARFDQC